MARHSTSASRRDHSTVVALGLALMLGAACVPSDRPRVRVADHEGLGRRVVERAVAAHGGLGRWRSAQVMRFRYRETWSAPFTWLGQNPWPRSVVQADVAFWLHQVRAEVRFSHEPGVTWILDEGQVSSEPAHVLDWNPGYALPRTHYLTLLPFKLLDPGARHTWLGHRVVDGRDHDEVLVTFDAGVGDSSADRYWVLFDRETGRLTKLFLTVTAYHALAFGDVVYEEWRWVDGLLLPARVQAYYTTPWGGLPLHLGEYDEVELVR
ncbi:MAG: hypothetical protein AB2A00_17515 [Myxococcota bacterium]